MPKNNSKFVLSYNDESLLIGFLLRILSDNKFDFSYKLADMGGKPIEIKDQKLTSLLDNPIRIEERGRGIKKREQLVFVVEDTDDLLISFSDWRKPLFVDLAEKDNGKITITNADGDEYIFQIHC